VINPTLFLTFKELVVFKDFVEEKDFIIFYGNNGFVRTIKFEEIEMIRFLPLSKIYQSL